ncbi:hypothetical protein [Neisseria meningitidis]|nr:hypothetical protein [Neisseria meningitidis]
MAGLETVSDGIFIGLNLNQDKATKPQTVQAYSGLNLNQDKRSRRQYK